MPVVAAVLFLFAIARDGSPAPAPSPGPKPGPSPGPGPTPGPAPNPGPTPDPEPPHHKPDPGLQLLLLGDEHALMLAPLLRAQLAATFPRTAGVPGATVDFWTATVIRGAPIDAAAQVIEPANTTLALVSLGHHDSEQPPKDPGPKVAVIARKLRDRGAKVAWTLPPKMPDPYGARSVLRGALAAQGIPTFDAVAIDSIGGQIGAGGQIDYPQWAAALVAWLQAQHLVPEGP